MNDEQPGRQPDLSLPGAAALHRIVQDLADGIGPRPAGSPAEARAADIVATRLAELGFRTTTEPFRALPTSSWASILIFSAAVAGWVVYRFWPFGGFLLAGLAFVLFMLEALAVPIVGSILPGKRESRNVIGVRPALGRTVRRIVLAAHLDSARSALLFHPRFVRRSRLWFVLTALAALALPTLFIFALDAGPAWWVGAAPAVWLAASALLFVHRELFMPWSPGANDDAAGVAVLLGAAAALPPLAETELWAVATGSMEAGLSGMHDFFRRRGAALDRNTTYFVNLEAPGRGELVCTLVEGTIQTFPAAPELLDAVRMASEAEGISVRPAPLTAAVTDAVVPLARSYKAISLLGVEPAAGLILPPDWHWETDIAARVDPDNLARATRVIARAVLLFEAGQVPPEKRRRRQ